MGRCNATYALSVCFMGAGAACLVAGLLTLALLYSAGHLALHTARNSAPVVVLCGAGLLWLLLGCCSYCTLQQRTAANWRECRRLQKSHSITLGRADDPASQAQPRISGFDPRYSPWPPN